jgi:hypothetical protein
MKVCYHTRRQTANRKRREIHPHLTVEGIRPTAFAADHPGNEEIVLASGEKP